MKHLNSPAYSLGKDVFSKILRTMLKNCSLGFRFKMCEKKYKSVKNVLESENCAGVCVFLLFSLVY